ncbi:MAG: sigma-70 family RNA polymerase sigma factor [Xanthomonadales bacterium]|nr:sigma-70 family RNA polymerase sigma factor [Xanthomonadales bacterium]
MPQEFLEKYTPLCWKIARAFADSPDDQQDLIQELFITLWQAMPRMDASGKESTFVYRVALNRAITWQRRRTTYARYLAAFRREPRVADAPDESRQLLEQLYAAIRRLPDIDRSLVLMHLEHLSYREIAEILDISESNVGARLSRLRKKLADDLSTERNHANQ